MPTYLLHRKATSILVVVLTISNSFAQSSFTKTQLLTAHISENAEQYKLIPSDLLDLEITDQHTDASTDVEYLYLRQTIEGKPIFNGLASAAIRDNEVVSFSPSFVDHAIKRVESHQFTFTWNQAIQQLANTLYVTEYTASSNVILEQSDAKIKFSNVNLSEETVSMEMGYYLHNRKLKPAWHILLLSADGENLWDVYLHAENGTQLYRKDLTLFCRFDGQPEHLHTGNHDFSPAADPSVSEVNQTSKTQAAGSYQVFALPIESPNHGNRTTVVDPHDSLASPFAWHDMDGVAGAEFTITRGNNVRAREDKDNNNTGGYSPDGGSGLEFLSDFDITKSAVNYIDASIINLFYFNNVMHDVWYHYGFDDAAGNFQENNYGRGGTGSDNVNADAQDGSGTNNANFQPLPEGQNGRMQMYLWGKGGSSDLLKVNSPAEIKGKYGAAQSGFGSVKLSPIPVTGKLVLVDDGTTNGSEGCNSLINSGAVSGNIAIIDRGNCNFDIKVKNAQDAGAVAVIMVNNVGSGVLIMAGNDPSINIPQIMISLPDGNVIKNKMTTADVFVSMYDSSTAGTFYYDSDFDNGIIAHEYTHGISTRLTGGSANSGCLQNTEQMGEGWSDFLGLIMSHEPGDKPEDFRGIGTYVTNESTTGGGIRPYPYSTDLSINPVTYDYIKQNQFTAPHGVGSVWCSMLWDLYWTFIDKYGYDPDIYEGTGGNNMVMHLVMDGLKLQPCGPGFTDGRDAILKADELRYGGNNKELIWQTFADRGLGYSADQGSTDSKTDGTQAFDMPPSFGGYSIDKVGPITANAGDTINYSVTVTNIGGETLNSLTLKDNLSAFGTFYQSDGQCAITFVNNSFTFSFADLKNGEQITCGYSAIVSSEAGGKLISLDDMETVNSDWIVTSVVGSDRWSRTTAAASSGITSWFASDPNAESDQNLQKEFDLTEIAKPYLVFNHFYNTEERWDGGVVEIRINGSWIDLGSKMIQNGYNQAIEQNPASRISGRNAFTGNSVDFITTVVDLTQYAGNVANIRFRMVSDALQDAEGWYVDDVALWNGFGSLTNVASVEGDGLKPQTDQVITSITNNDIKDTVVIIVVDINEKFAVYPNPVGAVVNVKFESKIDRNLGLKIINLHGQTVWTGNLAANTKGFYIPVKNYASGYYLLEVMDGEDVRYVRLLKE